MNANTADTFVFGLCIGALALLAFQIAVGIIFWKWRRDDEKFEAARQADLATRMREHGIHANGCVDSGGSNGGVATGTGRKEVP